MNWTLNRGITVNQGYVIRNHGKSDLVINSYAKSHHVKTVNYPNNEQISAKNSFLSVFNTTSNFSLVIFILDILSYL